MKTLEASGYKGWPYIHTEPRTSTVVLVWWAKSPSGRQSKYLHYATFNRLRYSGKSKRHESGFLYPVDVPTKFYGLEPEEFKAIAMAKYPPPKLRAGYEWQGPFLYTSFSEAPRPGYEWGHYVAMEVPSHDEGIPLGYGVTVGKDKIDVSLVAKQPLSFPIHL